MSFEHRHYLAPMFDPASVLLIGDGEPAPAWTARVLDRLAKRHHRHAFWHLGQAAQDTQRYELALLAVSAEHVAEALNLAHAGGCKAAVVVCDALHPAQSADWAQQARALGIHMLGPSTLGFVRPSLGLDAGRTGAMPARGNLALVSQSGALNGAILDWAASSAIGFSLVVSLGEQADVDLAQVLDFLANDSLTKSVVLYLEEVRQARSFMSALRALATVKPVVVLRGGRIQAASDTGIAQVNQAVSADAVYAAALRRAGAVQVRLFTQLFVASRILASDDWPAGRRLAVIGNGNGPALLAADVARWNAIELPVFAQSVREALNKKLPRLQFDNPLDLGLDAEPGAFHAALQAIDADPQIDVVLVVFAPHAGVDAAEVTDAVIAAAGSMKKPVYACWMGDMTVRAQWRSLDEAGIPVFRTPETAVDAYATVAAFRQNQQLLQQTPRSLSSMAPPDLQGARMLLDAVVQDKRLVLSEMESKALLAAFQIPVSRTVIARSVTEALIVAEQIGFPLAMKISSPDVASKSDVGGVTLNVRNGSEVRHHFNRILNDVRMVQPDARIDGVTLQEMRANAFARELYVGVQRDPLFGPVIAFGTGGLGGAPGRDATLELPPLNRFLARRMIERTRVGMSLQASARSGGTALEQLERLLVRVSEMACELPCIQKMDLNPVLFDEQGAIAVDARIVIDRNAGAPATQYGHLAILPYPAHLTRAIAAPNGAYYTIRAIRPEDADRLQAFVRNMSEESRYFRFISTLAELTPRMLIRYTQVDYDRELALVAVQGPDEARADQAADEVQEERIIGVVRYLLNPDGESCEFAIAIADDWQGQRLGSTLMRAIIDEARAKGLKSIEGYVLANNSRMLGLMSHLGFTIQPWNDDPSMRLVTIRFPDDKQ